MKRTLLILLAVLTFGCATTQQEIYFNPPDPATEYPLRVVIWQDQMQKNGGFEWVVRASENPGPWPAKTRKYLAMVAKWRERALTNDSLGIEYVIDDKLRVDIYKWCRKNTTYEKEPGHRDQGDYLRHDQWKPYAQILKDNLRGDCEDIATFVYGTLRAVGMPHQGVRMALYRLYFEDYCLVLVLNDAGEWVPLDTTWGGPFARAVIGWPVVTFNEERRWDIATPGAVERYAKVAIMMAILF